MENSTAILSSTGMSSLGAVQHYVKTTLTETKREIADTFHHFKEGISDTLDKTGIYIKNDLVLPVNNFIKDLTQMDMEFETERSKNAGYCICLDGKMIPVEEVLKLPMEENY